MLLKRTYIWQSGFGVLSSSILSQYVRMNFSSLDSPHATHCDVDGRAWDCPQIFLVPVPDEQRKFAIWKIVIMLKELSTNNQPNCTFRIRIPENIKPQFQRCRLPRRHTSHQAPMNKTKFNDSCMQTYCIINCRLYEAAHILVHSIFHVEALRPPDKKRSCSVHSQHIGRRT